MERVFLIKAIAVIAILVVIGVGFYIFTEESELDEIKKKEIKIYKEICGPVERCSFFCKGQNLIVNANCSSLKSPSMWDGTHCEKLTPEEECVITPTSKEELCSAIYESEEYCKTDFSVSHAWAMANARCFYHKAIVKKDKGDSICIGWKVSNYTLTIEND